MSNKQEKKYSGSNTLENSQQCSQEEKLKKTNYKEKENAQ